MIDPGRLKTRLVIAEPRDSDDGQGGVVRDHAAVATVWAAVMPGVMRNAMEADAELAVVRLRIVLRNGLALTLRHCLIDGDKTYRIVALRDSADRCFTEIDAEWRID